jgi:hypothetical protein
MFGQLIGEQATSVAAYHVTGDPKGPGPRVYRAVERSSFSESAAQPARVARRVYLQSLFEEGPNLQRTSGQRIFDN